MSGNHLVVGLSTRPQIGSKTSAVIHNLISSVEDSFALNSDCFELSELSGSLRAASFRTELGGLAKDALDKIERSDLLVIGISVKTPTGYPALLRYLFEMADPAALRGKPTLLVETHSNNPTQKCTELEIDMLMQSFGLNVVSNIRISSGELLHDVISDVGRTQEMIATLYRSGLNPVTPATDAPKQLHIN